MVDAWLVPALQAQGYSQITEVVVYEKRELNVPDFGNPDVRVRAATNVDMAEVIHLDRVCFEPQWTSVRVGQSVTWHSELKSPVRIYVSPGVFARASFLVRPGATRCELVRLGPPAFRPAGTWPHPAVPCALLPRTPL